MQMFASMGARDESGAFGQPEGGQTGTGQKATDKRELVIETGKKGRGQSWSGQKGSSEKGVGQKVVGQTGNSQKGSGKKEVIKKGVV